MKSIDYEKLGEYIVKPYRFYGVSKHNEILVYKNNPGHHGFVACHTDILNITNIPYFLLPDFHNSIREIKRPEEWAVPTEETPIDTPVYVWYQGDWHKYYWAGSGMVFSFGCTSWSATRCSCGEEQDKDTVRYDIIVLADKNNPFRVPPHPNDLTFTRE